jgi:hypothetical protein
MKRKRPAQIWLAFLIIGVFFTLTSCRISPANIKYVGARSSSYGIKPFPAPEEWKAALEKLGADFPNAQPTLIWIVGVVNPETDGVDLEFPGVNGDYPKINFNQADVHERYLKFFDTNGIKVFLQVEPGWAEVTTLINLVLNRYGRHPCVAGFGIDVEWYHNSVSGETGQKVTDAEGKQWEEAVKAHNRSYRLFLKHYDKLFLCPVYRGQIIFVDDTEQFRDMNELVTEMIDFADCFFPNPVVYQIGYPEDKNWWRRYPFPLMHIGRTLAQNTQQDCGIIWVDFTLRDLLGAH